MRQYSCYFVVSIWIHLSNFLNLHTFSPQIDPRPQVSFLLCLQFMALLEWAHYSRNESFLRFAKLMNKNLHFWCNQCISASFLCTILREGIKCLILIAVFIRTHLVIIRGVFFFFAKITLVFAHQVKISKIIHCDHPNTNVYRSTTLYMYFGGKQIKDWWSKLDVLWWTNNERTNEKKKKWKSAETKINWIFLFFSMKKRV